MSELSSLGYSLERRLRDLRAEIGDLRSVAAEGAKADSQLGQSVRTMSASIVDSNAMLAVDLLTDAEIAELRELIRLGADASDYGIERARNPALRGMYMQLSDIGFLHCPVAWGGQLIRVHVDPKAHWAVARHEQRAAEERRRVEAEERRHRETLRNSRWNLLLGWALGLVTAAAPAILGYLGDMAGLIARGAWVLAQLAFR